MKKKALLPVAAGAEVVALVGVLVAYLTLIAAALRDISRTLRLIDVGVRAMEKQTEPIADVVQQVNGNLDRASSLLRAAAERRASG